MESIRSKDQLLIDFLILFTPKVNSAIKYNHNEFSFVHFTIAKIFLKQTNIIITPIHFAKCLKYIGYTIYVKEGESGLPKDQTLLAKRKKPRIAPFFDFPEEVFAYVNVSSAAIFKLKKASQSINYIRNPTTKLEILLLKQKLKNFFDNYNQIYIKTTIS